MANGIIGKVTAGGGTHLVTSTFYGTCATAAGTAAKIVKLVDTTADAASLLTGMTLAVKFTNSNTVANPTLTIQTSGGTQLIAAKSIMRYGTTAPGTTIATSWRAGAMVIFVYDGTNWVMVSSLDDNTTYTIPTAGTTASDVGTTSSGGSATTWSKSDHVHKIALATGDNNGQVKIAGSNVSVKGLGSLAYLSSLSASDVGAATSGHAHGSITNDGKIGSTADYAVYTTTGGALTAGTFAVTSPTASGTGISYIETVSQDSKGKISATKSTVRDASASQSGIVTTGSQTFAGDKTFGGTDAFTVKATSIRFQNKAGNTSQALSGSSNGTKYPYVTSLMIGDGREVTLDEYGDGYLGIHSKYGIFIQSNSNDIKEYDATKTYTVGTLVWYDRKYYRCTTAISTAEAWTAGHWTAVPSGSGTIVIDGTVQPLVTESKDLGTSTYKWNNLYAKKINGTDIASVTAQTTQAVYPIKINAIGQITGYGSAVTLGTLASKSTISAHSYTPAGTISVQTAGSTVAADDITAWTTNTPTAVTKKTVVTSATVSNEILTISTGDSVTVTAGTAASLSYTARTVKSGDAAYKFSGTAASLTHTVS